MVHAYASKGDFQKAIADHTEAIRLNPKCHLAYCSRAFEYYKKGDYDKTIADCSEAVRLSPKCADAYYYRALANQKDGDNEKAVADYSESIRLDPNNPAGYTLDAGASIIKGVSLTKAIADCTRAIRLDSNARSRTPDAHWPTQKHAIATRRRRTIRRSFGSIRKIPTVMPDAALSTIVRASLIRRLAIARGQSILRSDPEYACAYYSRAYAYLSKGNYDSAAADYSEGMRPIVCAYYERAYIYYQKGSLVKPSQTTPTHSSQPQ